MEVLPLTLKPSPDRVFSQPVYPKPFSFNKAVAEVFDNMATRSIPLYREVTTAAVQWASRYYRPGTRVYDLGCSTGTTLLALGKVLTDQLGPGSIDQALLGIDSSPDMLAIAASKEEDPEKIQWQTGDIRTVPLEPASVVFLNYTLQFLPVADRGPLLRRVFKSLVPGGILFISEKLRATDTEIHEGMTYWYENFKLDNGYSRTEIERKKESLDQVLVPLTRHEHFNLLQQAGFAHNESIMQWNNFLTTISRKA